jgi:predicted nucleic acid-binding protein
VKVVLDTCVLFPTALRLILLGVAEAGLFQPLWSDRIVAEWARAALRHGFDATPEIASATARFPRASHPAAPAVAARLVLPDVNDVHVLATAIVAGADAILTFNARDFPRHVLAGEGVQRRDPDGFLWELWSHHPDAVGAVIQRERQALETASGRPWDTRAFLKRAGLPRLGKAVTAA